MKNAILFTVMLFICVVSYGKEHAYYFNKVENLNTKEVFNNPAVITLTDKRTIVFSLLNKTITYYITEEQHTTTKKMNQTIYITRYYCEGGVIIHFFGGEKLMVSIQDVNIALFFWYEE